ncbi:MAG: FkbM family methyltransferase [Streptosporangiales bacterium]|nr:FkbM family methyltransferase [Streptosporangiales bacterium]
MRGDRSGLRLEFLNSALRMFARRTHFVEDEILGLREVIEPGSACIDVGAEYGLYTYVLARLVGPGGTVHSIEPLPGPFRFLSAGIRASGCHNVRKYRVALGEQSGQGVLSLPWRRGLPVHGRAFLTTGAKGLGPNVEFGSARDVATDVLTLDELCAREGVERVDFIKADVEGAEAALLHGGQSTLEAHRPALLLEIEERHLAKYGAEPTEIVDFLAGRGYAMYVWHSGRWRETAEVTTTRRNYLFMV